MTKTAGEPQALFNERLHSSREEITRLYHSIYAFHPESRERLAELLDTIQAAFTNRSPELKERDLFKLASEQDRWFLSNRLCGMSLYVDRFCDNLQALTSKLDYLEKLGINLIHLMPLFESPEEASDGGYAVSDFRSLSQRFGTLSDLEQLETELRKRGIHLMLDIVLNHTSDQHDWAKRASRGEKFYQDYYYFYDDREIPDQFERSMPEIFPEAAPGNFTYIEDVGKWVMTVFHRYQWDLNYSNPRVFVEMLDHIFFYANLGVDILRIDAPAFIWKEIGTTCQNLPQAHTLLQLIKECVQVAAPGMALLGEAIVAPDQIMRYFGTGNKEAKECDYAYNATQMALQWDALATGDTRVMLAAQHEILKKPYGTTWITYTRCHDDIGLGYDDYMIGQAGFDPFEHRKFLKDYYSGNYYPSPARGALFSVNEKTGDGRISGSLASLCGLELALERGDQEETDRAIRRILLMQAMSFFIGGTPMLFYGDEVGYTNDYSYLDDPAKHYDNRWMHRPKIDWDKNRLSERPGSAEHLIFTSTRKLIDLRKSLDVIADKKNLTWLHTRNKHVAGFLRAWEKERVYCIFNFSNQVQYLGWPIFKEHAMRPDRLFDHWSGKTFDIRSDHARLLMPPYSFFILEPK